MKTYNGAITAIALAMLVVLNGCSGEADEAKKLGFASVEEMKEIHAKGWHTKQRHVEDEAKRRAKEREQEDEAKRQGYKSVAEAREAMIEKEKEEQAKASLKQLKANIKERQLSIKLLSASTEERETWGIYQNREIKARAKGCKIEAEVTNSLDNRVEQNFEVRATKPDGKEVRQVFYISSSRMNPGKQSLEWFVDDQWGIPSCDGLVLTIMAPDSKDDSRVFALMESGLFSSKNITTSSSVRNVDLVFDAVGYDKKIVQFDEWLRLKPQRELAKRQEEKAKEAARAAEEAAKRASSGSNEQNCKMAKGLLYSAQLSAVMVPGSFDFTPNHMLQSNNYSTLKHRIYWDSASATCKVDTHISGVVNGNSKSFSSTWTVKQFKTLNDGSIAVEYVE